MRVAGYPKSMEQWWLKRLQTSTGIQELTDRHPLLDRAIQKLTDLFTTQRAQQFPNYFADEWMLLAYGLFFFPRNFVRTQFPIVELLQRNWHVPEAIKILDLGSGTGAAGLGAAFQFMEARPYVTIHLTATDRSVDALNIHRQIVADNPDLNLKCDFIKSRLPHIPEQKYDLIILSFSLNEAIADISIPWLLQLKRSLTKNGVILIVEPALRQTSENLEMLRDQIIQSKELFIRGPCLHSQSCPLLAEGKFWCHEVRTWDVPHSLEKLNRHLYRSIHELKFSFLLISLATPDRFHSDPRHFRLISPWGRMKGKWAAAGCSADGRKYQYELLARDSSMPIGERGDLMRLETAEQHSSGIMRIKSGKYLTNQLRSEDID